MVTAQFEHTVGGGCGANVAGSVETDGSALDLLRAAHGEGFDTIVRYDGLFAGAGTRHFSWDLTGSGVGVDRIAVVPEPASVAVLALGWLTVRRSGRRG